MDNTILNEAMYHYGREKALELRADAPELTDTEIIDQELFIPTWHEGIQILDAPVQYEGQVYRVIQAHDSTGNSNWNPATSPSLFSICHTKNPYKAKPWFPPTGTSGMYYLGDCYIDENEIIWCQIYDGDNVYDAATLPERWIQVDLNNLEESGDTGEPGEPGVPIEPEEPETPIEPEQPEEPEILDEWPEWIQPVGAQDAYNTGAQVSHNNLHWISTVDNNVWEPGVYGWNEVTE